MKKALITGASGGIGLEVAKLLAAKNYPRKPPQAKGIVGLEEPNDAVWVQVAEPGSGSQYHGKNKSGDEVGLSLATSLPFSYFASRANKSSLSPVQDDLPGIHARPAITLLRAVLPAPVFCGPQRHYLTLQALRAPTGANPGFFPSRQ